MYGSLAKYVVQRLVEERVRLKSSITSGVKPSSDSRHGYVHSHHIAAKWSNGLAKQDDVITNERRVNGIFATSPNIFFSGANIILATSGNDDMALKGKNYPQVEDMNVSPLEKVPSVGSSAPRDPNSPWMSFSECARGMCRIGAAQERGFRDLAIVITCGKHFEMLNNNGYCFYILR
ncbi:hypothetical protein Tco_0733952 [Tanacetum coccineum]